MVPKLPFEKIEKQVDDQSAHSNMRLETMDENNMDDNPMNLAVLPSEVS